MRATNQLAGVEIMFQKIDLPLNSNRLSFPCGVISYNLVW